MHCFSLAAGSLVSGGPTVVCGSISQSAAPACFALFSLPLAPFTFISQTSSFIPPFVCFRALSCNLFHSNCQIPLLRFTPRFCCFIGWTSQDSELQCILCFYIIIIFIIILFIFFFTVFYITRLAVLNPENDLFLTLTGSFLSRPNKTVLICTKIVVLKS